MSEDRFEIYNGVPIYPHQHWGRDHAKLLLYVEERCLNNNGELNPDQMSANSDRHPHEAGAKRHDISWDPKHATRIGVDDEVPSDQHDDWDVMDDFEDEGLLIHSGPPNFLAALTELGIEVAAELRKYAARSKSAQVRGAEDPPQLKEFDWESCFRECRGRLGIADDDWILEMGE